MGWVIWVKKEHTMPVTLALNWLFNQYQGCLRISIRRIEYWAHLYSQCAQPLWCCFLRFCPCPHFPSDQIFFGLILMISLLGITSKEKRQLAHPIWTLWRTRALFLNVPMQQVLFVLPADQPWSQASILFVSVLMICVPDGYPITRFICLKRSPQCRR